MGAMTVRNLDPKVAEVLRQRARAEGRSMNDLVVEILSVLRRKTTGAGACGSSGREPRSCAARCAVASA